MKLEIRLKSFESTLLQRALVQIQGVAKEHDMHVCSSCVFPVSTQLFTVLRSPHVHKKSREQFKLQKHKALCTLISSNSDLARVSDQAVFDPLLYVNNVRAFFAYIKTMRFIGVQIHITLITCTYLRPIKVHIS